MKEQTGERERERVTAMMIAPLWDQDGNLDGWALETTDYNHAVPEYLRPLTTVTYASARLAMKAAVRMLGPIRFVDENYRPMVVRL